MKKPKPTNPVTGWKMIRKKTPRIKWKAYANELIERSKKWTADYGAMVESAQNERDKALRLHGLLIMRERLLIATLPYISLYAGMMTQPGITSNKEAAEALSLAKQITYMLTRNERW
jgi:hypothetical protein